jgi:ATP-dependent RNA helicase DeaD
VTTTGPDPFAAVPPTLRAALQRRGFTQLTEVQGAILAADDGQGDLRISSQTGSGKTVALGIALSRQVVAADRRGPTTLVVTPTRELAAQVKEELSWLFADLPDVRCGVVTGGTSIARERQLLQRRPALLVGTPGRLLDHVRSGALDLGSVTQLVLDEADQMLDLGFKDELDAILEALPKERRTHLVSATFPAAVKALADRFQSSPLLVAGTPAGAAHGDIEHVALKVGSRDHYAVLVNLLLLAGDERTLVFVRTREDTTALADKLAGDGFLAMPIHGELAQSQRTRTLQAFRRGAIHTLIATDVAARGLDVRDVTAVVHFDPPIDAETYVHRSGRTGRAGQKGRSYMFVVKTRANFARRLYREAGVEPSWEACPGAAEVAAHRLTQAGERAAAALQAATTPGASQHEIAERLLADRDPRAVVAILLGQMALGAREPFEIAGAREPVAKGPAVAAADSAQPSPPTPPAMAAPAAVRTPAGSTGRRLSAAQRGRSGAPPSWQRQRGADAAGAAFQRFRINWGSRDGAEARRVLAHVCRRGEIGSQLIGAIHVQSGATTFEVATDVAEAFERRARRPDRREPHLVITRDGLGDR